MDRLLDEKLSRIDEQMQQLVAFRERLQAYRGSRTAGCGGTGHGAFCECLNDAPLLTIEPKRY